MNINIKNRDKTIFKKIKKCFQIDKADPPFPRPAGYWWFGCSQNEGIVPDKNSNNPGSSNNGGGTVRNKGIGEGVLLCRKYLFFNLKENESIIELELLIELIIQVERKANHGGASHLIHPMMIMMEMLEF